MGRNLKNMKKGGSILELAIIIGIIAILTFVGIKSVKYIYSYSHISSTIINGLLSTARAIAVKESLYAGVRFQQAKDGHQYAIFIIQEPKIPYPENPSDPNDPNNLAVPFIAIGEYQPIDLGIKYGIASETVLINRIISKNNTRISFIFSPQGHLIRQWHSIYRNPQKPTDEYFNDINDAPYTLFKEDSQIQLSNNSLVIYNRLIDLNNNPASFDNLKALYINTYTGQVIHSDWNAVE